MNVAVVGATGLVGEVMLKVLEERGFPITNLLPVASSKSVGKVVNFKGKSYTVCDIHEAIAAKPDIALFSAGGQTSLDFAPAFAENGTIVIDNSSAWRMDPNVPLVVPEVNAHAILPHHRIIANPNCSTIQMVMALHPLHQKYTIKRLVISTYQSVTGTGVKAVAQLQSERNGHIPVKAYPHAIDMNCIPQCDVFLANDYTKEEMKMVNETRKILDNNNLRITATCVRVPVMGGHSEAVNIEFEHDFEIAKVREILHSTPGIVVQDDPANAVYPMPIWANGKDEVFVGRIRRDDSAPHALNLWICADNLRKGAATNAVQIAELFVK